METQQAKQTPPPPQAGNPSTELSTTSGRIPLGFMIQNLDEASKWAAVLAKSALVGVHQNKPEDVLIVIVTGRELGLSPMQSLRAMHVINNKAVMSAEMMLALVLSRKDVCEYFELIESDAKHAVFEAKRVGGRKESRLTFTIDEAKMAGLTGGNWGKYPATMLRWRCISHLARAMFPDVVMGMRTEDELEDDKWAERVDGQGPKAGETRTPPTRAPKQKEPEAPVDAETVDPVSGEVSGPVPPVTSQPESPKPTPPPVPARNSDEWMAGLFQALSQATTLEHLSRISAEAKDSTHPRKDELATAYGVKQREIRAKAQVQK